jgi:hypothetical protein
MAIQLLTKASWLPVILLFAGCEKWADGVVTDIEFPEHNSVLAASGVFTSGDSKAILSVNLTSGLQSPTSVFLPQGASATMSRDGQDVLTWGTEDVAMVGDVFQAVEMLVLELDDPLNLPPGDYELAVNVPGEEMLTASVVQPPPPVFTQEFELNADSIVDYWGNVIFDELRVSLGNRPGIRDVYGLRFEQGSTYDSDTVWSNVFGKDVEDPRLNFSSACDCWLVDDQNIDGALLDDIYLSRSRWEDYYYGYENPEYTLRLTVDLLAPSLGDFYRSVDTHENAADNFFANPSGIYSNTTSGFGHIGLASRSRVLIE